MRVYCDNFCVPVFLLHLFLSSGVMETNGVKLLCAQILNWTVLMSSLAFQQDKVSLYGLFSKD